MAAYSVTPTESQTASVTGIALPTGSGSGPADTTYSGTQYDIPNRRITGRTAPGRNTSSRPWALRAPNARRRGSAKGRLMDQPASPAGRNSYQFRLTNFGPAPLVTGRKAPPSGQTPGKC